MSEDYDDYARSSVGRLMELVRTLPPRVMRGARAEYLQAIEQIAKEVSGIAREAARDAALWHHHYPRWGESLNRRVAIEQKMLDAASGKRDMPSAQELREWALRLGTPDEKLLRAAAVIGPTGLDPEMGFILEGANRGELAAYDYGCTGMMSALQDILDGEDTGAGAANEPWASLRARVLALVAGSRTKGEPLQVFVRDGRVWIERGVQSFMLDYENAEEPEALQWYVQQVREVLGLATRK